jgi:sugar phosphate isomerase/epimerase
LDKPHETSAQLAAQGIRVIETSAEFFLNSDEKRLREVARIFLDNDVRLRSVHAPFGNEHNLSSPNPAIRKTTVDEHALLLRRCAAAGIHCIVVHAGTDETKDRQSDGVAWAIESLAALAPVAEETGVLMALENLPPGYLGCDGHQLVEMVTAVDSAGLGVCYDSGHAHMNGAMAATFELVKARVVTFHIHDNDGRQDLHSQPPFGTIDWEAFVKIFRTMRFDDAVTVEAAPWAKGGWMRLLDDVTRLFDGYEARLVAAEKK